MAWVIGLLGLLGTLAVTGVVGRLQSELIASRFAQEAMDAADTLELRIQNYADALRSLRGLYKTTEHISQTQFLNFIDSQDLSRRYPGSLGITYGVRVLPDERQQFLARMQDHDGAGQPTFSIFPPGIRPVSYVVVFGAPVAINRAAMGFDSASPLAQRESLELARDTGELQASKPLQPIQAPNQGPGLILRLAIYRNGMPTSNLDQRRQAFLGYANAVFLIKDLVELSLPASVRQSLDFELRDGGSLAHVLSVGDAPSPFFRTSGPSRLPHLGLRFLGFPSLDTQRTLRVGERIWHIRVQARDGFIPVAERLHPSWCSCSGSQPPVS